MNNSIDQSFSIIPATDGYYYCESVYDSAPDIGYGNEIVVDFIYHEVVAWRVETSVTMEKSSSVAEPVLVCDFIDGDDYIILKPNGIYISPFCEFNLTKEAAIDLLNRHYFTFCAKQKSLEAESNA